MRNKRTNITLQGELFDTYQELAELKGIPRATLITDYLTILQTHAQETIKILRAKNESQARADKILNDELALVNKQLNEK